MMTTITKFYSTVFTFLLLLVAKTSNCQEAVEVTDQTIKIPMLKEEELYFGFAAGDKIIFNFREVNDKEIKEVEIAEYPNTSKYSDFKTSRIENKTVNVVKQGVYVFRIKNAAMSGRICKIQIQRIPGNIQTQNFNTAVKWITKQDTTWNTYSKEITGGYDTTYLQKTKKELVKTEQREELIFDKTERVHSLTDGNRSSIFFTLPEDQTTPYLTKKVIAWAYWVGVGEEGNQAWKSNVQAISGLVKTAASTFLTPLGAFAVGAVAELIVPKSGEDITYAVTDAENKNRFTEGETYLSYDRGSGTAGYRKFTTPSTCQGVYFVCLYNDNMVVAVNTNIKAVAIIETNTYEDKTYTETLITPRNEVRLFNEPIITTREIPVTGF